eukprot:gb/GECG01002571.1/.p1 GENE.gb/GECG01002571.1/~~gb/GECG01002571.1/.p1  ORF type:complete len:579 (+),score=73.63 gb/GECG01002571.1/:1-1737(+)
MEVIESIVENTVAHVHDVSEDGQQSVPSENWATVLEELERWGILSEEDSKHVAEVWRKTAENLDVQSSSRTYWNELSDSVFQEQASAIDPENGEGLSLQSLRNAYDCLQGSEREHANLLQEHIDIKERVIRSLAEYTGELMYTSLVINPIESSSEFPAELPSLLRHSDIYSGPRLFQKKKRSLVAHRNHELEVKKSVHLDIEEQLSLEQDTLLSSRLYAGKMHVARRNDIAEEEAVRRALPVELYCLTFPRNIDIRSWTETLNEYMALQELILSPYFPDVGGTFDRIDTKMVAVAAQNTLPVAEYFEQTSTLVSESSAEVQTLMREYLKALASIECMSTFDLKFPPSFGNIRIVEPSANELNVVLSSLRWGSQIPPGQTEPWNTRHQLLALAFVDFICWIILYSSNVTNFTSTLSEVRAIEDGTSSLEHEVHLGYRSSCHLTLPAETQSGRSITWSNQVAHLQGQDSLFCRFEHDNKVVLRSNREGPSSVLLTGYVDESEEIQLLIGVTVHRTKPSPFLLTVVNMYSSAYWQNAVLYQSSLHNLHELVSRTKLAGSTISDKIEVPSLLSLSCHPYFLG